MNNPFAPVLAGTLALILLGSLLVMRPHIWNALWFRRMDPRPAALFRVSFGLATFATFILFGLELNHLFTDQGIFTAQSARQLHGVLLDEVWDPELGWSSWSAPFGAVLGRFSVFFFRNDPAFVYGVYTLTMVALALMILGIRTRISTLAAFVLTLQFNTFTTIYHSGWDNTLRAFFFFAVLMDCGQVYSVDAWWRRRRELLAGKLTLPPHIPAWPVHLAILQLTVIYLFTGLAKSGPTWWFGTALHYALNLHHFYRVPMSGLLSLLQWTGVLPVITIAVHFFEMLFPVAFAAYVWRKVQQEEAPPLSGGQRRYVLGASGIAWLCICYIVGYASYQLHDPKYAPFPISKGEVQVVATAVTLVLPVLLFFGFRGAMRRWPGCGVLLTKWPWLAFGIAMHLGIDLLMNVGLFSWVMISIYPLWLTGEDMDRFSRLLASRAAPPGQAGRPLRHSAWERLTRGWWEALRYRLPPRPITVYYGPDAITLAAALRPWDRHNRLRFEPDAAGQSGLRLALGKTAVVSGTALGAALIKELPALAPLRPLRALGLGALAARLALWLLHQPYRASP